MTRIPRVIHRIWFGSVMPEECIIWGNTWGRHHPRWQMRLWGDHNLPESMWNQDLVSTDRLCPAQRSDILRYEILRVFGGVYVDTDFECLGCIDQLLDHIDAFCGSPREGQCANSILGAVPDHPLFAELCKAIPISVRTERGILEQSGPRMFEKYARKHGIKVFDREVFFPYDFGQAPPAIYPPQTIAVHHWQMSWVAGRQRRRGGTRKVRDEGMLSGSDE